MSFVTLTHHQFQSLLATLNPDMIRVLLTMQTPYSQDQDLNSKEVADFLAIFTSILNAVLQLEVCFVHEGITRDNARQFIAHFDRWLTPTYDAAIVRTNTVGDEIRRILNHMAFLMRMW